MGSMGKASAGAGGFCHWGLFGPGGLSLFPLALLCLALGAGGYQQDEIELNELRVKLRLKIMTTIMSMRWRGSRTKKTGLNMSTLIFRKIQMGMASGITSTTLMMTMTVFLTSRMMMMTGTG